MGDLDTERVRRLLRGVSYRGFLREIVGAGFAGESLTKGQAVETEFKPNTRDAGNVADMERNIRKKICGPGFLLSRLFQHV